MQKAAVLAFANDFAGGKWWFLHVRMVVVHKGMVKIIVVSWLFYVKEHRLDLRILS
jgi:hypothetical protein